MDLKKALEQSGIDLSDPQFLEILKRRFNVKSVEEFYKLPPSPRDGASTQTHFDQALRLLREHPTRVSDALSFFTYSTIHMRPTNENEQRLKGSFNLSAMGLSLLQMIIMFQNEGGRVVFLDPPE